MTKVFKRLDQDGGNTIWGNGPLTAGEANIEPGLLVTLDSTGRAVNIASASGSKAFGFAYGDRSLIYAPTTQVFANGEALNVLAGQGFLAVSADFFASGSLPTEAAYRQLFQGAGGKLALGGTILIGRLVDLVSWTVPTGGTGTTENVAIVQYDLSPVVGG